MTSRDEILTQLLLDAFIQEHWVDGVIRESEENPDAPFAELGPVLKRLLATGATRRDLSLVAREAAYDSVSSTFYTFSDFGMDDDNVEMLHESCFPPAQAAGKVVRASHQMSYEI
jgi:hypothetical protein